MSGTTEAFDFIDGARSYNCHIEAPRRGRPERWWWFEVQGDASRYAPFCAASDDTEASVRARIVDYYETRMARRGWAAWQDKGGARSIAAEPSVVPSAAVGDTA